MAFKAATSATKLQPTPRYYIEPSTSSMLQSKYAIRNDSVSAYFSSFASTAPVTTPAAFDPRYNAQLHELPQYAWPPGAPRAAEVPGASRLSAPTTSDQAPSTPTFDVFAALAPAIPMQLSRSQIPYSAPSVSMPCASVPVNKTPSIATQSAPFPYPVGVPGAEVPLIISNSTGKNRNAIQPPGRPPGDPDDDPDRKRDDKEIDATRKGQFLIDNAALKAAKNRSRGNIKC